MRVVLSPFVKPDLEDIADWIAQDNPRLSVSFIQEIRAKFRNIGRDPLLYQLRPEIGDDARISVVGHHVILSGLIRQSSASSAWFTAAVTCQLSTPYLNPSRSADENKCF